jgi:hypothetical protein
MINVTNIPVEMLHLSIDVMRGGILYRKEFCYGEDLMVYVRTSAMIPETEEDGWNTKGWFRLSGQDGNPVMIREAECLVQLADTAARKGWLVEWNPAFKPVKGLPQGFCLQKNAMENF